MEPKANAVEVNDIELTYFEWGERGEAPSVLLVHATGFHARCWDQTIARLDAGHAIALDMRGHGRSGKTGPFTWDTFGSDVTAFIDELDLESLVGVGHSMGGHSVTQAAAHRPSRFLGLVLVDPVILSPESYDMQARGATMGSEAHPVARRRNSFADADEMFERLASRGSYALWEPQVLRDYCVHGLLPDDEAGGYRLACPPEIEASIYTGSAGEDIYELIGTIEVPVTVMRAMERDPARQVMDFSTSPTWPQLATRFKHATDIHLPDLTHFLPMQAPDLVAAEVGRAIDGVTAG